MKKYCTMAEEVAGQPVTLCAAKVPFVGEDRKFAPAVKPIYEFPAACCPRCMNTFPIWDAKKAPEKICGGNTLEMVKDNKRSKLPFGSPIYWSEKDFPMKTSKDVEEFVKAMTYVATVDAEQCQADGIMEAEGAGQLAKVAASILMGVLFAAGMARFDLLRVTCRLATRITKWTKKDEKRLCMGMGVTTSRDLTGFTLKA